MGRAILIICSGVLISLGFVGLGSLQQSKQVIGGNASYADRLRAKNAAHTVIQMAMREMHYDSPIGHDETHGGKGDHIAGWNGGKYHDSDNPFEVPNVDNSEVRLWVEVIYPGPSETKSYDFEPDTIRVVSEARYSDSVTGQENSTRVIGVYVTSAIDEFVQSFKGALTIATDKVDLEGGGPATLSGNDLNDQCQDKPAVSLSSEVLLSDMESVAGSIDIQGDIIWEAGINYITTGELIARLEGQEGVTFIKGDYQGEIGSETNPGVYFVEGSAEIKQDVEEGYGILVFRSGGSLAIEDTAGNPLPVADYFTFNGLSVFENAYTLNGQNYPSVNGSVVIGETDEYLKDLDIDFSGNIRLQYDCSAEQYAKMAAANLLPYKRYRLISTFE